MQTLTIDFWELAALTLLRFSISLMLSLSPHLRRFSFAFQQLSQRQLPDNGLDASAKTKTWKKERKILH